MTFQRVRTTHGWHLRHVAANHEPVVVGEPLTDPDSVVTALASVFRDVLAECRMPPLHEDALRHIALHALFDVDERTPE